MAATARAVPKQEVSTADDMDLHSDSGLDFGDGDIDLDFELAPHQDDDVSVRDAVSINGQDDEAAAEQDDFMADHEDLIEEDIFIEDEDIQVTGTTFTPQTHTPTIIDEDLIDYSDDDEGPEAQNDHDASYEEVQVHQDIVQVDDGTEQEDALQAVAPSSQPEVEQETDHHELEDVFHADEVQEETFHADEVQEGEFHEDEVHQDEAHQDEARQDEVHQDEAHEDEVHEGEAREDEVHEDEAHEDEVHENNGSHASSPHNASRRSSHHVIDLHDDEAHNAEGDDGDAPLHPTDEVTASVGVEHEEQDNVDDTAQADYEQYDSVADDSNHEESFELPSVTVNYAGNELWLFQAHDTDSSGDWLLEDLSLAKSQLSEVFRACRISLGDDVSNEHEIGFRFDHLHNLELYEDNTACVAVSLERLVGLYHSLQAQDGIAEPESFYISLLFRPRFVTLLSDIAKFAEEGSGYSALNVAVAAGDTHFTNVFSASSSDEPTEWDGDEHENLEAEVEEQAYTDAHQEEHSENHSPHDGSSGEPQEAASPAKISQSKVPDSNASSPQGSRVSDDHPTAPREAVSHLDEKVSTTNIEDARETDARREQKEDDLIEYSDDEDDEDVDADSATAVDPSPWSSTVQGDELQGPEDGIAAVDTTDLDEHDTLEYDTVTEVAQDTTEQKVDGNDGAAQSYQDFVEVYDADDPFHDLQQDGENQFSLDPGHNDEANHNYTDLEYESLDQQLDFDFAGGETYDGANDLSMAGDEFGEPDDFYDFKNAPEWATDQQPGSLPENSILVHDDVYNQASEEVGVAEHPAAAVTSTASPTAVSSSDLQGLPLQKKRSIDEAGHGADDALGSIDTKRPRV